VDGRSRSNRTTRTAMSELLISIAIALIMLVGLVGIFIPFFPDLLLIWGAALGYGFILNWKADGLVYFVLITGLMLIGIFADFWMGSVGGKLGGASWKSIFLESIAGFFGMFLLTPIGGLAIMLLSIFLLENRRAESAKDALKAMLGIGIGYGASFVIKLLIALGMIAVWLVWVLV